jgi:hypothetical protein
MPNFFFHLRRGQEWIPDEDGEAFPDVEAAYLHAFGAAQELWTMALARRDDPIAYTFEVQNEKGVGVFVLPLREVLDASRKGRTRIAPAEIREVLRNTHAQREELIAKNRMLRDSLVDQIERTRTTINQSFEILRTLRQKEYALLLERERELEFNVNANANDDFWEDANVNANHEERLAGGTSAA